MLALLISPLLVAAAPGVPAYLASCPTVPGSVLQQAAWVPPEIVRATNRRVRFYVDLGSDGHIRRVAVVESSGDPNFDTAAQAGLRTEKFAPPMQNCIATSSVTSASFNVPLISLVTPPPAGASPSSGSLGIPAAQPASAVTICPAPFVQLTSIDVPATKAPPGTVNVDVGLSAAAGVTSVALATSSGNKSLDALATASAKTATYQFVLPAGCGPKPTTYRLELTYR